MAENFTTPILLMAFNRPVVTAKVFDAIRAIRPRQLFIASDGPRPDRAGEQEAVFETRKVVEYIDWDCEVARKYQEKNLGCKLGVSSAITWFFEQVSEGIILEDDCLPSSSFFPFCSQLLERYRKDNRVGSIAGTNYLGETDGEHSYFFSHHCPIWGWGTWQRAWDKYDLNMSAWAEFKAGGYINTVHRSAGIADFFAGIYEQMAQSKIDTWDHQWSFTCLKENWLTIIPRRNLVTNIGFSIQATHTKDSANVLSSRPAFSIDSTNLMHPTIMLANPNFEEKLSSFVLSVIGGGAPNRHRTSRKGWIRQWLRRLR